MKRLSTKHIALLAGSFGIYQLLVLWFFGITHFITSTISEGIILLFTAFSFFLIEYGLLLFIRTKTNKSFKWWLATSFLCSSLLTSIILFLLGSINSVFLAAYFSGFIVSAFIPAVIVILYFLFLETTLVFERKLSIQVPENDVTQQAVLTMENTKGRVRLEIPVASIICFEANDNYVNIYYLDATEKVIKKLERLSMRRAEELIEDYTVPFLRVHKSYLINKQFIQEVTGRSQAYRVQLKHFEELIPVSRKLTMDELLG